MCVWEREKCVPHQKNKHIYLCAADYQSKHEYIKLEYTQNIQAVAHLLTERLNVEKIRLFFRAGIRALRAGGYWVEAWRWRWSTAVEV